MIVGTLLPAPSRKAPPRSISRTRLAAYSESGMEAISCPLAVRRAGTVHETFMPEKLSGRFRCRGFIFTSLPRTVQTIELLFVVTEKATIGLDAVTIHCSPDLKLQAAFVMRGAGVGGAFEAGSNG